VKFYIKIPKCCLENGKKLLMVAHCMWSLLRKQTAYVPYCVNFSSSLAVCWVYALTWNKCFTDWLLKNSSLIIWYWVSNMLCSKFITTTRFCVGGVYIACVANVLLPPLKEGGFVTSVSLSVLQCLSVCLPLCMLGYSKSYERILVNFFWRCGSWPKE